MRRQRLGRRRLSGELPLGTLHQPGAAPSTRNRHPQGAGRPWPPVWDHGLRLTLRPLARALRGLRMAQLGHSLGHEPSRSVREGGVPADARIWELPWRRRSATERLTRPRALTRRDAASSRGTEAQDWRWMGRDPRRRAPRLLEPATNQAVCNSALATSATGPPNPEPSVNDGLLGWPLIRPTHARTVERIS